MADCGPDDNGANAAGGQAQFSLMPDLALDIQDLDWDEYVAGFEPHRLRKLQFELEDSVWEEYVADFTPKLQQFTLMRHLPLELQDHIWDAFVEDVELQQYSYLTSSNIPGELAFPTGLEVGPLHKRWAVTPQPDRNPLTTCRRAHAAFQRRMRLLPDAPEADRLLLSRVRAHDMIMATLTRWVRDHHSLPLPGDTPPAIIEELLGEGLGFMGTTTPSRKIQLVVDISPCSLKRALVPLHRTLHFHFHRLAQPRPHIRASDHHTDVHLPASFLPQEKADWLTRVGNGTAAGVWRAVRWALGKDTRLLLGRINPCGECCGGGGWPGCMEKD